MNLGIIEIKVSSFSIFHIFHTIQDKFLTGTYISIVGSWGQKGKYYFP